MRPDRWNRVYLTLLSFLSMLLLVQNLGLAEEIDPHPGVETFRSKYKQVTEAVQAGSLPRETGAQADALNFSFQKYLIQSNARIEIYRLEAREYDGQRQGEALDNLMRETAARERALVTYTQKLDQLSGKGATGVTLELPKAKEIAPEAPISIPQQKEEPLAAPAATPAADEKESEKETGFWAPRKAEIKAKDLNIEIEIKPEDIINEEQVAD